MLYLRLKRCAKCGAICGEEIEKCPGFQVVPRKHSFWEKIMRYLFHRARQDKLNFPCLNQDFYLITMRELKVLVQGELKVYFQKWPNWPEPEAWHRGAQEIDASSSAGKPTRR